MSQAQLVAELVKKRVLKTAVLIEAWQGVDRADFVRPEDIEQAYGDHPLAISKEATISQPTTVALMLEWLAVELGMKVLDVGSGSGWTTALLGRLVGSKGSVWGVEIDPELVYWGQGNVAKYPDLKVEIYPAENRLGWEAQAPYDRILVSAAAESLPQELVDQLAIGGRMVLPVGSTVWRVEKRADGSLNIKKQEGFRFVSLQIPPSN